MSIMNTTVDLTPFNEFLLHKGSSDNTIRIYLLAVHHFLSHSDNITPESLQAHKAWLLEHYRPATVNVHIHGINQFLLFLKSYPSLFLKFSEQSDFSCLPENFKLPAVKYQQKTFLDNVISKRNYEILKKRLKQDENWFWYFIVRFLGATGMRVSELLKIKAEHVKTGMMDLYSKGGKMRRIYFPTALCEEAESWLKKRGTVSGYIFTGRNGQVITARGVHFQLKVLAKRYKIPPEQVYPHSFRHRFAKNFLTKFNDISLLADLMGHESIETTRIYLTRSSEEQQKLIDRLVKW